MLETTYLWHLAHLFNDFTLHNLHMIILVLAAVYL